MLFNVKFEKQNYLWDDQFWFCREPLESRVANCATLKIAREVFELCTPLSLTSSLRFRRECFPPIEITMLKCDP